MDAFRSQDFDSAYYPPTPSYNGSYNNSPYSQTSDLPDIEYPKDSLGLFDHDPLALSSRDEYDPASYDHQQSNALLIFDNDNFLSSQQPPNTHLSLALTPDEMNSPGYYDHSSPASSNGAETDDRRSPASSASSHPHPHAQQHPSPHINFNSLHVDSPYLSSNLAIQPDNSQGSPMVKPQSPPHLVIPDASSPHPQQPVLAPAINAPEGDGVGPRLQIVPATPVSGGGVGDPSQVAAYGLPAASQRSQPHGAGSYVAASANAGQASYASTSNFVFPPSARNGGGGDSSALSLSTDVRSNEHDFLIPPSPSRGRSKSDTSLPAPAWASAGPLLHPSNHHHQGAHPMGADPFGARGSVDPLGLGDGSNMSSSMAGDLEGIRPSSASALHSSFGGLGMQQHHQQQQQQQQQQHQPFASFQSQNPNSLHSNGFLSPNMAGLVRRSNSDSRSHHIGHHAKARSEDLRMFAGTNSLAPYPPSAHQDFLSSTARQFLSPAASMGEPMPSIRGQHHRRMSSGSHSHSRDRSLGGSPRVSPYPSPSASPAHRLEALPNISGSGVGVGAGVGIGPGATISRPPSSADVAVPKVNVTTTATAEASYRRRTNDAKFACPVAGCGSTFTRHFNLKGHMRSHNDEKPFTCKWPGCLKGFARQHDCKRHEQLHSNHRPFTCEGCKKPFARLDALNRHLRSEGGAGCAKAQEAVDGGLAQLGADGLGGSGGIGDAQDDWGSGAAGAPFAGGLMM